MSKGKAAVTYAIPFVFSTLLNRGTWPRRVLTRLFVIFILSSMTLRSFGLMCGRQDKSLSGACCILWSAFVSRATSSLLVSFNNSKAIFFSAAARPFKYFLSGVTTVKAQLLLSIKYSFTRRFMKSGSDWIFFLRRSKASRTKRQLAGAPP